MVMETLTKKKTIEEHRKMWNWIADQIEQAEEVLPVWLLKKQYLKSTPYYKELIADCFLCEYSGVCSDSCKHCPVISDDDSGCLGGLYGKASIATVKCYEEDTKENRQYAAELCRKIANLPERPDIPGDILE